MYVAHRVAPPLSRLLRDNYSMDHGHEHIDVPDDCTFAEWDFDPEGLLPVDHFEHVAETSFELPLGSEELFFTSQGASQFANGVITYPTVARLGRTYYNSQHHFEELTKVCQLSPEQAKNGVGFRSSSGSTCSFRPHPMLFGHRQEIDYTPPELCPPRRRPENTILFNELSLFATNTAINVQSVVADTASVHATNGIISGNFSTFHSLNLHTTNGVISGNFNTSRALNLETTNGPITAVIGLFNDNADESTKVRLHTTNGPVNANVSLFATTSSSTGGLFNVDAHSTNSPVRVVFPDAPVDHVLTLAAHTTNSPVELVLHPTYEGGFTLHGSRWLSPQVRVSPNVDDPAGRGRRRDVHWSTSNRADVSGSASLLLSSKRIQNGLVMPVTLTESSAWSLPLASSHWSMGTATPLPRKFMLMRAWMTTHLDSGAFDVAAGSGDGSGRADPVMWEEEDFADVALAGPQEEAGDEGPKAHLQSNGDDSVVPWTQDVLPRPLSRRRLVGTWLFLVGVRFPDRPVVPYELHGPRSASE
ncbi:uncharacterized protein B0H18DRAFT_1103969 [Fomitopsis serialis]|uniref:uncharacterized protein n=1 Tax=Fomitopsis serialis TaxID=139415 RepID=UPI0020078C43|nr:uncharacterized protein B0H18DRAFT_1103969 [Neoantrodia serialis]KAH9927770.1 hypothetical protein B0H18DRAFT_1103969 [Neoantrodia serialis]